MRIDDFNSADLREARATAALWADVPDWVDALIAGRPYPDVGALRATARDLAADWAPDVLDRALRQHPRIGDRPAGADAAAQASRREQSAMAGADAGVSARIAQGNAEYERRFGRVFLIRAAGRSPEEILAELDRRLSNSAEEEAGEACGQLAEIALGRIDAAFACAGVSS